jgi:hypothetical protein
MQVPRAQQMASSGRHPTCFLSHSRWFWWRCCCFSSKRFATLRRPRQLLLRRLLINARLSMLAFAAGVWGFRAIQVSAIGLSTGMFAVYEILFEATTLFHHSNVRIPIRIE